MKPFSFSRRCIVLGLALALSASGFVAGQAGPAKTATQPAQRILIHMKEYIAGVHETYMGLELADRLQRSGANVSVWLELRAVRLADDRLVREGVNPRPGSRSFSEIYKSFIEHGGRVLACHHCAQFEGIGDENLRKGAKFVDVEEIAQFVLDADKILDY